MTNAHEPTSPVEDYNAGMLEQVGWIEAGGTIKPGTGELMKAKCSATCQFCRDAEPVFRLRSPNTGPKEQEA